MPSAGIRFAGETAFLILVAIGLGLAGFDPIVIGVVMLVAWVLVALLERASAKEAARAKEGAEREPLPEPPPHVERVEVEAVPVTAATEEPEPEAPLEPERKPTVSERSARAILASSPPPIPPEPAKAAARPSRRHANLRGTPARPPPPQESEPEPEPLKTPARPPREWNLWELQRAAREAPDESRHEEWIALLIHLREFANADGDLPLEFDGLVRESFGPLLEPEPEPAATS